MAKKKKSTRRKKRRITKKMRRALLKNLRKARKVRMAKLRKRYVKKHHAKAAKKHVKRHIKRKKHTKKHKAYLRCKFCPRKVRHVIKKGSGKNKISTCCRVVCRRKAYKHLLGASGKVRVCVKH